MALSDKQQRVERYSYQDYLKWDDNERWELIDGVAYNMTPAPSFRHQRIVGNFYQKIATILEGKSCVPGIAPTDILLSEYNVVQPDVFVVCDPEKITDQIIKGAPEIVIEVLSPGTSLKDRREKKQLYERFSVMEYLIVDPIGQHVERFLLQDDGTFDKGAIFAPDEKITFHVLPEVEVELAAVFAV